MKKIKLNLIFLFLLIVFSKNIYSQSEPFLGQISIFAFDFAPRGWAQCSGQQLSIAQNQALFALLGTTFGGNGIQYFNLPDLRGRFAVGVGNGPGLSQRTLGESSGSENTTLLTSNLPQHNHIFYVSTAVGTSSDPSGKYLAKGKNREKTYSSSSNSSLSAASTANTGTNTSFNKMNPYLVLNFSIALQGIFPSRE